MYRYEINWTPSANTNHDVRPVFVPGIHRVREE